MKIRALGTISEERHGQWKGDAASTISGRGRARSRFELGQCQAEGCEKPAVDRHHVDGNTLNNDPANVRGLCRRHHMLEDGRLEAFRAMAARPKPYLTHCQRGHEMTDENVYVNSVTGKRKCRACIRLRDQRRSAKRAA